MKLKKQLSSFVKSASYNPWFNLAIEEFLVDNVKSNEVILYLWQNKDTVVIGSNQNPWKECNINKIEDDGVKLARRLSGGGAVYHDIGNLNFTFIMGKELYDLEKQLDVILKAVNSFGFNGVFSGRNDIVLDGKKFSGNAYFFGDDASYHHGTILVDSDILKLSKYLNPSKQKIVSKGIDSVKSRVVNLSSINSEITIEKMKDSIFKCFQESYGQVSKFNEFTETTKEKKIIEMYERYASWQWTYGESPSFDVYYEDRFLWGEIQIGLNLIDGYINDIKIFSDALNTTFVKRLTNVVLGVRYDAEDIIKAINSVNVQDGEKEIFNDILQFFKC